MEHSNSTIRAAVSRHRDGQVADLEDWITVEEPLAIKVHYEGNGRPVAKSLSVTMRTPGDDFELAAGWLYSEGLVSNRDDIERIEYCTDARKQERGNVVSVYLRPGLAFDETAFTRHFYTTSACGVCGKSTLEQVRVRGLRSPETKRWHLDADMLRQLPERLLAAQRLFEQTGGLHAAALVDPGGQLMESREDVGRHNAVDKLIGARWLRDEIPLHDCMLLASGRAGFEIVQKALAAGVPVMAAVGAPSSLAVELAREYGMTLVGFLQARGFNVYSGAQRIRDG
jgi:FdhD protein